MCISDDNFLFYCNRCIGIVRRRRYEETNELPVETKTQEEPKPVEEPVKSRKKS